MELNCIELNASSRYFVNLQINLIFVRYLWKIIPRILKIKRLRIDHQIVSVCSGYRDRDNVTNKETKLLVWNELKAFSHVRRY